ncbi:hypothetical protein GTQ40_03820 [Flavobacteriaceae bacterium R38]|nr:hypothetical protein [Flavobacteriaceae bacterium R38]
MKFEQSRFANNNFVRHSFDFGNVYFLSNILISEYTEGYTIGYKNVQEFLHIAEDFYGDHTDLVYLSNRVNSYSVKPLDWIKIKNKYKNLKSIGIVHYNKLGKRFLNVEKLFCPLPISDFYSLDEAVAWAANILIEQGKDNIDLSPLKLMKAK